MAELFDPYHKWLGISPKHQPPDHYRLLGLGHFENDGDVIDMAATRQLAHVRTYQNGPQGPKTHKLLNEIAAARLCLLDPHQKRAYDRQLRDQLEAAGRLTSEIPLEQVQPLVGSLPPAPALFLQQEPSTGKLASTAQAAQPTVVAPPAAATRWKVSPEMETPSAEDVALVPLPVVAPPVVIAPPALHPPAGGTLPRLNLASTPPRLPKEQTVLAPVLLIAGLSLTAVACVVGLVLAFSAQGGVAEKKQPAAPTDTSFTQPAQPSAKVVASASSVPPPAKVAAVSPPVGSGQNPTPFPLGGGAAPAEQLSRAELARLERQRPSRGPGLLSPRPPEPPLTADEARERVSKLLLESRQALADRDDERSVQLLIDAEQLLARNRERLPPAFPADAEHLRALYDSVKKFWLAVSDGAYQKTVLGEKFEIRKNQLTLEARAGGELTFTLGSERQTLAIRRLPPEAAIIFALRSFGEHDAWGQAHCAVFLAVDGKAAKNPRLQREARTFAREAVAKLGSSADVLKREFGAALQAPSEDDPVAASSSAPAAPAVPPPAPPTVAPAAPPVVLDSPAFRDAKTTFEAATREFRRKVFAPAAEQSALLSEWEPQLEAAQSPNERYLRLELALLIAAKAGDSPRILKWGAEAAQLLGQHPVEQQGRYLLLCTPQTEEQRTAYFELLTTAITEAEALAKLELASHLAAHGKQTALNARNPVFVQQFTDRAKALEQLQKSRAAGASSALLPPLRGG